MKRFVLPLFAVAVLGVATTVNAECACGGAAPATAYYAPATTAYYAPATTAYYAPSTTASVVTGSPMPTTVSSYYPTTTAAYYAPAETVATYYAPEPVTSYYAPVTTYYAQRLSVPIMLQRRCIRRWSLRRLTRMGIRSITAADCSAA